MRLPSSSLPTGLSSPLLINDRFCSRTSSFRCCQYCFSSFSRSFSARSCVSEVNSRVHTWGTKIGSRNKSRERMEKEEKENYETCNGYSLSKSWLLRQTRFIYASSQSSHHDLAWRLGDANPIDSSCWASSWRLPPKEMESTIAIERKLV